MIPYKTVISITARLLNRIPTSIGQSIASGLRKLVKREIKSAKSMTMTLSAIELREIQVDCGRLLRVSVAAFYQLFI